MKTQSAPYAVSRLSPVLFSFFVMGFVDVVGISTSYVKADFGLSDTLANLLPLMVFVWFAVCSLPTGLLMARVGRKRVVLGSAWITTVAMLLPLCCYSFPVVLAAFALLGIGNTLLQVALNPLLLDVSAKNRVTSMLTLGQFIKAISSMLGPVMMGVAAGIGGNWRLVFAVYAFLTLVSGGWLFATPIPQAREASSTAARNLLGALLRNPKIRLAFSAILLIVGFEVGLMTAVPKYLLERCGLPLAEGGLGCSLYFSARTLGTFAGAIMLARYPARSFLIVTMGLALAAFGLFLTAGSLPVILGALFLTGLFCANVFPVIFSMALQTEPRKADAISALMIMGVAGGAVLPLLMGMAADASSQGASLFIPFVALGYILFVAVKLN